MKYLLLTGAILVWYLGVAARRFLEIKAQILVKANHKTFMDKRKDVFFRSLLWIVPPAIYYWKNQKWQKEIDCLGRENDDEI